MPSTSQRAEILDVLRGIAIAMILVINITVFGGYLYLPVEVQAEFATWPLDRVLRMLQVYLVEAKFYSTFSFLFGLGFSIFLTRAEARGAAALRLFHARLLVLLLIGYLHIRLIWEGDILLLYALLGFLLPLFRKLSDRTLIVLAAALILSPVPLDMLTLWMQRNLGHWIEQRALAVDNAAGHIDPVEWYLFLFRDGAGWAEYRIWMETAWMYRVDTILTNHRIPKVFGMFLVGLLVGRHQLHFRLVEFRSQLLRSAQIGLGAGLLFGIGFVYFQMDGRAVAWEFDPAGLWDSVFHALSVAPMAIGYMALIAFLWVSGRAQAVLSCFAPLGRMALTNYIAQSLICIPIFYGFGLGLGTHVGLSVLLLIGMIIIAAQMLFSSLWLKYFQFGPLEWAWKCLTYRHMFPFRVMPALRVSP